MSAEKGRARYEKLMKEGALDGHNGQTIFIHPESGLYVIGEDDIPAAIELRRKVDEWLRQAPIGKDKPAEDIYSRRIGQLAKI